jgi:choice-of-anchor B domain-containing protein
MQVVDMTRIDEGIVSLLPYSSPEFRTAHTIAVDEESGYLYVAGARPGNTGMRVYSLEDPASPRYLGAAGRVYFHEVTPVTYTEGPYAGRQIVFVCAGFDGLEIWDVTNKAAMTRLSGISYPQQRYTHQAWPSEDRRHLYINDELDEEHFRLPHIRTIVINIENLGAPFFASSFTNDTHTVDHNLYVKGPYIFEANYTTGLRVFDARHSPTAPREVGFLDTRPEEHDALEFRGLWSNYPYFPSGVVIGSDINRGLFVMDPARALRCMDPDLTRDGFIDQFDYLAFVTAFESGEAQGDYNRDGFTDFFDYDAYVAAFEAGC